MPKHYETPVRWDQNDQKVTQYSNQIDGSFVHALHTYNAYHQTVKSPPETNDYSYDHTCAQNSYVLAAQLPHDDQPQKAEDHEELQLSP